MLDTLAVATKLKSDGFSKAQAEGMAKVLNELTGDLATKVDLENAKRDITLNMKLWMGTILVALLTVMGGIATLIVNLSKLAGSQ